MLRIRHLAVLVGALALFTLGLSSQALAAGTYSWNLASDFTATGSGANPDHDQYGATPWSYVESATTASLVPSSFQSLSSFATGVDGGVSTWSDPSSGALVGINPTASTVTDASATYPPGQIVVEPASNGAFVAIGWTSPLAQAATVSISGSLTPDTAGTNSCAYSTSWTLEAGGTPFSQGTTQTSTTSFTTTTTVAPGASIYLTVASRNANSACNATAVALDIRAQGTPPAVSLTAPAAGTVSLNGTPTFSGAASSGFGASNQVTLRVYSGSAASGTPVQTLSATTSGATWSATSGTALPDGVYTAQAEQDDRASPTDVGLSAPVTFTVVLGPAVTITSPSATAVATSEPVVQGTAGVAAGDAPTVNVYVFGGTNTNATPIRELTATIGEGGGYSVQVTPALADGQYTVAATQAGSGGGLGFSPPRTFSVVAHVPVVRLQRPVSGGRVDWINLAFAGRAATAYGDSRTITVSLYRGSKATGARVGTVWATASGSTWAVRWGRKLAPGTYTARASQPDAAGQAGLSTPRTFRIIPPPPVVDPDVTLSASGRVTMRVACNEPPGDLCAGTVLILTKAEFQPVPGGPLGHLTVAFSHAHVEGGHNHTFSQAVSPQVVAALRGRPTVPISITVSLKAVLTGTSIHLAIQGVLRQAGPHAPT